MWRRLEEKSEPGVRGRGACPESAAAVGGLAASLIFGGAGATSWIVARRRKVQSWNPEDCDDSNGGGDWRWRKEEEGEWEEAFF